MQSKPDDRSDNVAKLRKNIDCTVKNMELADEMIAKTGDRKATEDMKDKNRRRKGALDALRNEIKDEAEYQAKK